MGFSGDARRMVWQFSSSLYVLQPGVVSCPFRLCGCTFSLVLGAYAPGPRHCTVGPHRTHRRSDGRRLFSKRRFPFPATYRIPVSLCVDSNDWNPRCVPTFPPKSALPFVHHRCHDSHLRHAQDHFWGLSEFWLLSSSPLGLVCS